MRNRNKVEIICYGCGNKVLKAKHHVNFAIKRNKHLFCSKECNFDSMRKRTVTNCGQCNKDILVKPHQVKRIRKTGKIFCSRSCAGKYHCTHKSWGCNRSRMEIWIESQLKELYPNLEIHFNKKDTINSELDIYFPTLKLAVELNGIFHYEPIFGIQQLNKIRNNDNRKFQACLEKGIELCIIDASKHKYLKHSTSKPYLDIITNIINQKLNTR